MHKGSYSVFGKIDFFSVLQALLVSLGGSQTEDWVLESPELQRVGITPVHSRSIVLGNFFMQDRP